MTLLISARDLAARRDLAGGSLNTLALSLAGDFAAVLANPLYVPEQKALLSRDGGRCAMDGTLLDFDPFSPRLHICPRCATQYTGEFHDRFWIYWYQLWLAERAVHGAMLGALGVERGGTEFALTVLDAYAERYPTYPNVDNVLGPTRPFFSTYLESIWLLQLCIALDLVESSSQDNSRVRATAGRFRDQVVEPSRGLIQSYDEGMSNRQVWNNAAMMAASRSLGRPDEAEVPIWSESGVVMHLSEALLPDGTWYEGENYHLFAHRGLWYAVVMAEHAGVELPGLLVERFNAGFATPFLTALPDFTLPSRRDSQYAISLRQWRFAEMCELGLARDEDRLLGGVLGRLYSADIPRVDSGRWRSSAEAERNTPATALTRADLGWKSLLFARGEESVIPESALPSVLLQSQGIGVLRRNDGEAYIALDYGHSGGGHGHPDRLNLLLARGKTRWLDDVGTGSYVEPSLRWYRSTLAHNAPLIDGRSQRRANGTLLAYDERGGVGWISADAPIAQGAVATRTIVAMPDYMIDEVRWRAPNSRLFDLPLHVDAVVVGGRTPPLTGAMEGGDGLEDGFQFLRDTTRLASCRPGELLSLHATRDAQTLDLWVGGDVPFELWKATGPGAPGQPDASFILLRSHFANGMLRAMWNWGAAVDSVALFPGVCIENDEARHEHVRTELGWRVVMIVGGARSTIELGGLIATPEIDSTDVRETGEEPVRAVVLRPNNPVRLRLGAESYRQSEDSWDDAGQPAAVLSFENEDGELVIEVAVSNVERTFAVPGSTNPLDNENADINGAGVQLYLRTEDTRAGYVLVPLEPGHEVGIRPIDGWGDGIPVQATWTDTDDGYVVEMHVEGLTDGTVLDVDVIVNEMPAGRQRRRGQLVLSGGAGEFVYLRGDRHDPDRLIPMLLTDA